MVGTKVRDAELGEPDGDAIKNVVWAGAVGGGAPAGEGGVGGRDGAGCGGEGGVVKVAFDDVGKPPAAPQVAVDKVQPPGVDAGVPVDVV